MSKKPNVLQPVGTFEDKKSNKRPKRVKSTEIKHQTEETTSKTNTQIDKEHKKLETASKTKDTVDKKSEPVKSKMWIRPKSGSQAGKPFKKTDPVSLYQAYKKDWEKFKENICESSHSNLRWSIREKMMGNI